MSLPSNPTPNSHRILIVDDAPAVREALHWLFEDEPDLAIIGEAGDGSEALLSASALHPDAVILDIEMPLLDGYSVTRQLKTLPSPPVVILLSIHGDPLSRQRGAEAGSDGFIEKSGDWTRLIPELRRALAERGSTK
jgi:DNA-binding NarL/FixJ family response regulator